MISPRLFRGSPSSHGYAVTNPGVAVRSTEICPSTVLRPAASGTDTDSTPPAASGPLGSDRVSVRRFGNDVIPVSNDVPFRSMIMSTASEVKKHTSPSSSASTIKRFDHTGPTRPS